MQFSLIYNQYVEPNSSAHLCRFLKKIGKVHLFYFVSINVYFNVICVVFFTFWQEYMKFDFFIFRESLLVWNQVVIFCNLSLRLVCQNLCEHGIDWCHLQIVLGLRQLILLLYHLYII